MIHPLYTCTCYSLGDGTSFSLALLSTSIAFNFCHVSSCSSVWPLLSDNNLSIQNINIKSTLSLRAWNISWISDIFQVLLGLTCSVQIPVWSDKFPNMLCIYTNVYKMSEQMWLDLWKPNCTSRFNNPWPETQAARLFAQWWIETATVGLDHSSWITVPNHTTKLMNQVSFTGSLFLTQSNQSHSRACRGTVWD